MQDFNGIMVIIATFPQKEHFLLNEQILTLHTDLVAGGKR
jgi:hypothetical protein